MLVTTPATPLTEAHPGGFFMPRIYDKAATTIDQQIDLLRRRGLVVTDEASFRFYLMHIGYYRLSAYELPFQHADHTDDHHKFIQGTTFEQVLDAYTFDRKLRLLVMDAIERIEVALKSVIINEMCIPYGPHWYMERTHFVEGFDFEAFMRSVHKDIDHGKDRENVRNVCIRHYYESYDSPTMPPLWMVFEALTFGTVSLIYGWLPRADQKRIADHFGLGVPILKSWLQTASYTRNLCAHHARLWNRIYTKKPKEIAMYREEFSPNSKFYSQAVMLHILMQRVSPQSKWAIKLKDIIGDHPDILISKMGFPEDWELRAVWNV